MAAIDVMHSGGFNSRTREGCDARGLHLAQALNVSIHAPARGAIRRAEDGTDTRIFNSRTREGCDSYAFAASHAAVFQFTHPRGVRSKILREISEESVSIHAPARGAMCPTPSPLTAQTRFQFTHPRGVRCSFASRLVSLAVSIHAPARGAIRR